MSTYLDLQNQFQRKPTLCNFFQVIAHDTWERIMFARTRKGLKIFETTITQNILFEIIRTKEIVNARFGQYFWNIRIYEALNEKANGNDIELYMPYKNGYIFFPTQAKIIYHQGFKGKKKMRNGNYPKINHFVNATGQQINSLLAYASTKGGYPLYLFYNYVNKAFSNNSVCGIQFGIEQYGCSIVSARYMKSQYFKSGSWTIPTFDDLHPAIAYPFFVLPCCFSQLNKLGDLGTTYFPLDNDFSFRDLRIYSNADIEKAIGWKVFRVDDINERDFKDDNGNPEIKFYPKFRIVLEREVVNPKFNR